MDTLRTLLQSLLRRLPEVMGTIGGLIAVASVFLIPTVRPQWNVFSWYIIGLNLLLIVCLVVLYYRYSRRAACAEAMTYVHCAIDHMRDTHAEVTDFDEEALKRSLEPVVNAVSSAFTLVTHARCRACIKVCRLDERVPLKPTVEDLIDRLRVGTLARDTLVSRKKNDELVLLRDNSDFRKLFESVEERCFFENNLPRRFRNSDYRNSSIPVGWQPTAFARWPLEYRATIVWPIRRVFVAESATQQDVLGYLCVDAYTPGVFRRRFDFDIGAAVADALYMYLKSSERIGILAPSREESA